MALLLRDTATLLRPRAVTVLPSTTSPVQESQNTPLDSHPGALAVMFLSDLAKLFEPPVNLQSEGLDARTSRQNHKTLKLSFYAGQLLATPSFILGRLSDEIMTRSKAIEREALIPPAIPTSRRALQDSDSSATLRSQSAVITPRIVELP